MAISTSVLRPSQTFSCPATGLLCNAEAMQGYLTRLTPEECDIGLGPTHPRDQHSGLLR